jgi:hypothetical protein
MTTPRARRCMPTYGHSATAPDQVVIWLESAHPRSATDLYATWPSFLTGLSAGHFMLHLGPDFSSDRALDDLIRQQSLSVDARDRAEEILRMTSKVWDQTGPAETGWGAWPHAVYAAAGAELRRALEPVARRADSLTYIDPYVFALGSRGGLRDLLRWAYWCSNAELVQVCGHIGTSGDGPKITPRPNEQSFRNAPDAMAWFQEEWLPNWSKGNIPPEGAAGGDSVRTRALKVTHLITPTPTHPATEAKLHDRMLAIGFNNTSVVVGIGHGIRAFEGALDIAPKHSLRTTLARLAGEDFHLACRQVARPPGKAVVWSGAQTYPVPAPGAREGTPEPSIP